MVDVWLVDHRRHGRVDVAGLETRGGHAPRTARRGRNAGPSARRSGPERPAVRQAVGAACRRPGGAESRSRARHRDRRRHRCRCLGRRRSRSFVALSSASRLPRVPNRSSAGQPLAMSDASSRPTGSNATAASNAEAARQARSPPGPWPSMAMPPERSGMARRVSAAARTSSRLRQAGDREHRIPLLAEQVGPRPDPSSSPASSASRRRPGPLPLRCTAAVGVERPARR